MTVKLNSFGETVARVEAERMAEAKAAVEAGWTPDDHPAKCCPPTAGTPQPKREGRSLEEVERLRTAAARKAKWWVEERARRQQALDNHDAAQPQFDHGMLQVDLKTRNKSSARGDRLWKALNEARERVAHFRRLEAKYAAQIEKRTS